MGIKKNKSLSTFLDKLLFSQLSVAIYLCQLFEGFDEYVIVTDVPTATLSNSSSTSALCIRTQPWLTYLPMLASELFP